MNYSGLVDPMQFHYFYMDYNNEYESIFVDHGINLGTASVANFYRNHGVFLGISREIVNGLYVYAGVSYSEISSVHELQSYDFYEQFEIFKTNEALEFNTFVQVSPSFSIFFRPFQKYHLEPKRKIVLPSKWPNFSISTEHGVQGIFNSTYKYTNLNFGFTQRIKLGILGVSQYSLNGSKTYGEGSDIFLATRSFIASDKYTVQNPITSFSLLDTTIFTRELAIDAHYIHHFQGALMNQFPLLRKLRLRSTIGTNFLYSSEQDIFHLEAFCGVSRPFKMFGEKISVGIFPIVKIGNTGDVFNAGFKIGLRYYYPVTREWD